MLTVVTFAGCNATSHRRVMGTVADEYGNAVDGAHVTVGYHGWAWNPYLVWDHFYSAHAVTAGGGRFSIELTAPARLLATVETEHGVIRNASVPASADVRLITPASGPSCACWSYTSPMFIITAPIGSEAPLSPANARQGDALERLVHRVLVERAIDSPRTFTLTVRTGESGAWFLEDGTYGSMLDYHPPLELLDYEPAPSGVRLGVRRGVLILRGEPAHLVVEIGTGITTQTAGNGVDVESVLLPARWAQLD